MGENATVGPGPQHLQALQRANRVRLARAAMKRRVAAQEESVSEIVLSCPFEAESMSILELLMSQRRWGRTRSRRVLLGLGIPENKQIGTLTQRQRVVLAGVLDSMTGAGAPVPMTDQRRAALQPMPALVAAG